MAAQNHGLFAWCGIAGVVAAAAAVLMAAHVLLPQPSLIPNAAATAASHLEVQVVVNPRHVLRATCGRLPRTLGVRSDTVIILTCRGIGRPRVTGRGLEMSSYHNGRAYLFAPRPGTARVIAGPYAFTVHVK